MTLTTPPPIPGVYTLNELSEVSKKLNSLQARLIMIINLYKWLQQCEDEFELDQIEFIPASLDVQLSNHYIELSEQTKATLAFLDEAGETNKQHFFAVTAFNLLFGSNPYLGSGFYRNVVLSSKWEKEYFGTSRNFIFLSASDNEPDEHYQRRTLDLWYSENHKKLKGIFEDYFIRKQYLAINDLSYIAYELLSLLSTDSQHERKRLINENAEESYILSNGKKWIDGQWRLLGEANMRTDQNGREDLYLTNLSELEWYLTTATEKKIVVMPKNNMPLRKGMRLKIGQTVWTVEEYNTNK